MGDCVEIHSHGSTEHIGVAPVSTSPSGSSAKASKSLTKKPGSKGTSNRKPPGVRLLPSEGEPKATSGSKKKDDFIPKRQGILPSSKDGPAKRPVLKRDAIPPAAPSRPVSVPEPSPVISTSTPVVLPDKAPAAPLRFAKKPRLSGTPSVSSPEDLFSVPIPGPSVEEGNAGPSSNRLRTPAPDHVTEPLATPKESLVTQSDVASLRSELASLKASHSSLRAEYNSLRAECVSLRTDQELAQKHQKLAQNRLSGVEHRVNDLVTSHENMTNAISSTEDGLKEIRARMESIEQEVKTMRVDTDGWKKDTKNIMEQLQHFQGQVKNFTSLTDRLDRALKEVNQQVDTLTTDQSECPIAASRF